MNQPKVLQFWKLESFFLVEKKSETIWEQNAILVNIIQESNYMHKKSLVRKNVYEYN